MSGMLDYKRLSLAELEELKETVSPEIFLNAVYASFPSIWMENMLQDPNGTGPFSLREYQKIMADDPNRFKILRLGRQLGKSVLLCAMALWRAICYPNSRIIIVTPRETQLKSIVSTLRNFIAKAHPSVKAMFDKSKAQPIELTFKNGSFIRGFIVAKESASSGGSTIRGQSASDLFIDEADYIDDKTMDDAIMPTVLNFPFHSIWLSSTPTGRVGYFYKTWQDKKYSKYHYKSYSSPSWTKDMQDKVERLDVATRMHEYEAEWYTGQASVFRADLIQNMQDIHSRVIVEDHHLRSYNYDDTEELIKRAKYRIIGVDWNKFHGTRIVGITIEHSGKICMVFKKKIDTTQFQQHIAIDMLKQLDQSFKPDYIAVDVGYGEMQIEELRMTSVRDPANPLGNKIVAVNTGGTMDIVDVFTGETRSTYVKNFVVKSAVRTLEQGMLLLPEEEYMSNEQKQETYGDLTISDQMRNYFIKEINYSGREIYECKSDHDLDAFMFAIYAYVTEILKINNLYDLLPMTHSTIVESISMKNNKMVPTDILKDKDIKDNSPVIFGRPSPRGLGTNLKMSNKKSLTARSMGNRSRSLGRSGGRSLYG